MSVSIIALFIILLSLIVVTFLGIKAVLIVLNKKIRMNAEKSLSFYDEVFEKRKKTIERLEKLKNDAMEIPQVEEQESSIGNGVRPINEKGQASYYNEKFITRYQNIKDRYKFDKHDIVKTIVDEVVNENNKNSMTAKISSESVYALSTLNPEKQVEILRESLSKRDNEFLDKYIEVKGLSNDNFSIIKFIEYVRNEDDRNSNKIRIITSDKTDDFSNLGKNIITEYDSELCEGIEIETGDKFYNFGIRKREIIGGKYD